jgi:TPR repeat protein
MMARDGLLAEAGRHHMEEAAMWLQMAAERNHPAAMTRLALVLESGIGMPPDYDKAADYLLAAVKAGDESAFDALMVYTESRMEGTLRAVQQRLYRAGYYNGKLDGIFGSGSKSAFLSYAKDRQ